MSEITPSGVIRFPYYMIAYVVSSATFALAFLPLDLRLSHDLINELIAGEVLPFNSTRGLSYVSGALRTYMPAPGINLGYYLPLDLTAYSNLRFLFIFLGIGLFFWFTNSLTTGFIHWVTTRIRGNHGKAPGHKPWYAPLLRFAQRLIGPSRAPIDEYCEVSPVDSSKYLEWCEKDHTGIYSVTLSTLYAEQYLLTGIVHAAIWILPLWILMTLSRLSLSSLGMLVAYLVMVLIVTRGNKAMNKEVTRYNNSVKVIFFLGELKVCPYKACAKDIASKLKTNMDKCPECGRSYRELF